MDETHPTPPPPRVSRCVFQGPRPAPLSLQCPLSSAPSLTCRHTSSPLQPNFKRKMGTKPKRTPTPRSCYIFASPSCPRTWDTRTASARTPPREAASRWLSYRCTSCTPRTSAPRTDNTRAPPLSSDAPSEKGAAVHFYYSFHSFSNLSCIHSFIILSSFARLHRRF